MIGYLEGTVKGVIRDAAVVLTAGVGYRVHLTAATLTKVKEGDALSLWTHLAVRENAQDLYGFEEKDELTWFELLLTVSGIGPRSALAIMNSVDAATLTDAIGRGDASVLARAYGIGRKTAEKIVLELKDKVAVGETNGARGGGDELVEALVALGYSLKEARDAAQAVPKDLEGVEARVREALRNASSR